MYWAAQGKSVIPHLSDMLKRGHSEMLKCPPRDARVENAF